MLCEKCGKNNAEVFLVRIVNGQKREERICRSCAEEMMPLNEAINMMKMSFSFEGVMDTPETLKNFFTQHLSGEELRFTESAINCPHCGEDITLDDLIGGAQSEGQGEKEPSLPKQEECADESISAPSALGEKERELSILRRELELVLLGERYERAAQIRDRIAEIEKESKDS